MFSYVDTKEEKGEWYQTSASIKDVRGRDVLVFDSFCSSWISDALRECGRTGLGEKRQSGPSLTRLIRAYQRTESKMLRSHTCFHRTCMAVIVAALA